MALGQACEEVLERLQPGIWIINSFTWWSCSFMWYLLSGFQLDELVNHHIVIWKTWYRLTFFSIPLVYLDIMVTSLKIWILQGLSWYHHNIIRRMVRRQMLNLEHYISLVYQIHDQAESSKRQEELVIDLWTSHPLLENSFSWISWYAWRNVYYNLISKLDIFLLRYIVVLIASFIILFYSWSHLYNN